MMLPQGLDTIVIEILKQIMEGVTAEITIEGLKKLIHSNQNIKHKAEILRSLSAWFSRHKIYALGQYIYEKLFEIVKKEKNMKKAFSRVEKEILRRLENARTSSDSVKF